MKIIKINDYEIDIVFESDKYIDIYTFIEICHDDPSYLENGSWIYIDEGKGWRLTKLNRMDRVTKQIYELTCCPDACSYNNYYDADIKFTCNGVEYHRLLTLNQIGNKSNMEDYVVQDYITSVEEHDMPEEMVSYIEKYKSEKEKFYESLRNSIKEAYEKGNMKKVISLSEKEFPKPDYSNYVNMNEFQSINIDLANKKYKLQACYREQFELEEIKPFKKYIYEKSNDCKYLPYRTNELLQAFYEMNSKIKLFGYPNQKVTFYEKDPIKGFTKVKKKEEYKIY